MAKIIIDPVNRMEGHLGVEATHGPGPEGYGSRITHAELHGNLFRGIEMIMQGRDPRDAMVICQRI
jgi:hydrogenase large subunit